jgi:hypothetical protein
MSELTNIQFFLLEPEVGGGFGKMTRRGQGKELEVGPVAIPRVELLHYEFEGWMGDHILQTISTFIVSEDLALALDRAGCTGITWDEVIVTREDQFVLFFPSLKLPRFKRLVPTGTIEFGKDLVIRRWSGHDVCWGINVEWKQPETISPFSTILPPYTLAVSKQALDVIKGFPFSYCEVSELISPQSRTEN